MHIKIEQNQKIVATTQNVSHPHFEFKDYISSGQDNKIIDPDEGIHCSKKQFENNGNYRGNKVVEWPKEGWTLSLDKAPEFQQCFIFSYLSGGRNREEKRQGAFKSKREGSALFKALHVFDVKFHSSHDDYCFFDARVTASMTRNKIYRTKLRQNKTGEVMSAQCTCKAGANGYYKITKIVRALLLAERRVCMTVCKHGCVT